MLNQDGLHACHRLHLALPFRLQQTAMTDDLYVDKPRHCASRVSRPVRQMQDFCCWLLMIVLITAIRRVPNDQTNCWCVSFTGDW